MKVSRLVVKSELWLLAYTIAYGNARSLTHRARAGIEPVSCPHGYESGSLLLSHNGNSIWYSLLGYFLGCAEKKGLKIRLFIQFDTEAKKQAPIYIHLIYTTCKFLSFLPVENTGNVAVYLLSVGRVLGVGCRCSLVLKGDLIPTVFASTASKSLLPH